MPESVCLSTILGNALGRSFSPSSNSPWCICFTDPLGSRRKPRASERTLRPGTSKFAPVARSEPLHAPKPRSRPEALSLSAGDELLVLCKSDRVVIIPKPKKFAKRTAGLHREVWQGADAYLKTE